MLCGICELFFHHTYWRSEAAKDDFGHEDIPKTFLPHQRTFVDLRTSASLSCYVCYRLLQDVLRWNPQFEGLTPAPPSHLIMVWTRGRSGFNPILQFRVSPDWKKHSCGDLSEGHLEEFKICQVPASDRQIVYEATTSTTDIALNASIGRQWIDRCMQMHPKCQQLMSKGWCPTRLLDVSDQSLLTVIETKALNIISPYMTLSHCWGSSEIPRLTINSYATFKTGIWIANLPPTFVDAVAVARTYNIQYIWIDSLCIIQDSVSDWTKEATSMSEVYRNSVCNIGASAASSGASGLFYARDCDLVRPPRLTYDDREYMIFWTTMWYEGVSKAPLHKRGWVVQERWLCPRMLHFGAEQLFWECRTATASEALPEFAQHEDFFISGKIGEGRPLSGDAYGLEREGVVASTLGVPWSSLIDIYSEADLTVQSDKMVALSGLVSAFSMQHPEDQYLAGLWKRNFVAQLPWYTRVAARNRIPEKYTTYVAPSWSWLSVKGGINPLLSSSNERNSIKQVSTFVDCHLEFHDPRQMSHLKSGWVQIQGPPTVVMVDEATEHMYENASMAVPEDVTNHEGVPALRHAAWLDDGLTDAIREIKLYYVPLALTPRRHRKDEEEDLHGVLLQLKPADAHTFYRVGYSVVYDPGWIRKFQKPSRIAEFSSLPYDAEQGYTVILV